MKFILALISLLFISCTIKPYKKINNFPNEDKYIIKALYYENNNEIDKALKIYQKLYDNTNKKEYLEKIITILFYKQEFDKVLQIIDKSVYKNDFIKYKILSLIGLKKFKKAKIELNKIRNNPKLVTFYYKFMTYIALKENNIKEAIAYLKSLYALKPSTKNLLTLVDILIQNNKYNEALAYLQTHTNLHDCSIEICKRLITIYKYSYDYENLANVYEKLSKYDYKYIILAIENYIKANKYNKALYLIDKYKIDDKYKLFIYEKTKNYNKAALIAYQIYKKTSNIKYLIKYCEYKYLSNKKDKKNLKEIAEKLKSIIKIYPQTYLYNFLGYILIDGDINYKKGIFYVKKALEKDPYNQLYLDSLAWGYYKTKQCKKAYEIIKKISIKEEEILMHKNLIKKCLKEEK